MENKRVIRIILIWVVTTIFVAFSYKISGGRIKEINPIPWQDMLSYWKEILISSTVITIIIFVFDKKSKV